MHLCDWKNLFKFWQMIVNMTLWFRWRSHPLLPLNRHLLQIFFILLSFVTRKTHPLTNPKKRQVGIKKYSQPRQPRVALARSINATYGNKKNFLIRFSLIAQFVLYALTRFSQLNEHEGRAFLWAAMQSNKGNSRAVSYFWWCLTPAPTPKKRRN